MEELDVPTGKPAQPLSTPLTGNSDESKQEVNSSTQARANPEIKRGRGTNGDVWRPGEQVLCPDGNEEV